MHATALATRTGAGQHVGAKGEHATSPRHVRRQGEPQAQVLEARVLGRSQRAHHAGIVDQNIEAAVSSPYLGDDFVPPAFVGYILMKLGCPFPPLILAMVLGPVMEENLRRSMFLSEGNATIFITRPISGAFILATVALLIVFIVPALRRYRRDVGTEAPQ